MTIPLFTPPIQYRAHLDLRSPMTLRDLCTLAEVHCRASGPWTCRQVDLLEGEHLAIFATPGDTGNVQLVLPAGDPRERARLALGLMAYGMHDLVAKESIKNQPWTGIPLPKGRPRQPRALSNAERQQRYRRSLGS